MLNLSFREETRDLTQANSSDKDDREAFKV